MKKKNCIIFPFYRVDVNPKGKLYYISFKFVCLSLYMIGFYYVLLNNSLENNSLEITKNCNIYKRNLGEAEKNSKHSKRKKNLKHKNEGVNKTKSNINNIKCNKQNVKECKHSINNDHENSNTENNCNSSINNINYNDKSKQLTETELRDVLNSFKECPSKEDLKNIWNHTIGVAKEGVDDIEKNLKRSIQKYLDNDFHKSFCCNHEEFVFNSIWEKNISRFYRTIGTHEIEYTKTFFRLINEEHTLDDVLKFIYSFIEHFQTLKKELHEEHQKELLQKIAKVLDK
ncbi:Plasmodium exported protein (PHISTa), unknown function [Plasmodium sp. gorilla clade G2]|uniref:Plasmodium exported protein (PHISTa), unknown function n=1 Tax=Plasmodium sp. gorilla clade G2 TaxID=880535 RepID=UPI000D2ECF0C|nr:Plasmodium exported protein (PHISTa), unknown function [Plasmodium sp. gorilla clade G2]SOV20404.1 Plasmodium exported protein (PHISTa), unknown function [Plasmodium sp. gorilla clade G2]